MNFNHKTVLLRETIQSLNIMPDGIYVDGTAGGGGCSYEIAKRLSSKGKLICIDTDPDAVEICKLKFKDFKNITIVNENFSNILKIIHNLNIEFVDGIVLDLGVSSFQLDTAERGFSYNKDAPLDMRMSKNGLSAFDVVNHFGLNELTQIIRDYGEERFAFNIAKNIINQRMVKPIKTTLSLAEIINKSVPNFAKRYGNPSRKTFQALRIFVNSELKNLSIGLKKSFSILKNNGTLSVITFHSLEDKIVKSQMLYWAKKCVCPHDFPVCNCSKEIEGKIITKKPITPNEKEINENNRSRSAKLRVFQKQTYS